MKKKKISAVAHLVLIAYLLAGAANTLQMFLDYKSYYLQPLAMLPLVDGSCNATLVTAVAILVK